MNKTTKYSPEIRERVVRMVCEHRAEHDSETNSLRNFQAGESP